MVLSWGSNCESIMRLWWGSHCESIIMRLWWGSHCAIPRQAALPSVALALFAVVSAVAALRPINYSLEPTQHTSVGICPTQPTNFGTEPAQPLSVPIECIASTTTTGCDDLTTGSNKQLRPFMSEKKLISCCFCIFLISVIMSVIGLVMNS